MSKAWKDRLLETVESIKRIQEKDTSEKALTQGELAVAKNKIKSLIKQNKKLETKTQMKICSLNPGQNKNFKLKHRRNKIKHIIVVVGHAGHPWRR